MVDLISTEDTVAVVVFLGTGYFSDRISCSAHPAVSFCSAIDSTDNQLKKAIELIQIDRMLLASC